MAANNGIGKYKMEVDLQTIQQYEDILLKKIVDICNANNIQYYMWVGSALGTVKYGQHIPWDDDVDIAIPCNQMERFLQLMNKLPNEYGVMSWEKGDKLIHPLIYAKNIDYKVMHVDVFPLYGIPSLKNEQERISLRTYLLKVIFSQKVETSEMQLGIKKLIKTLYFAPFTYSLIYKKFIKLLSIQPYEDAEFVFFPNGSYGLQNIIPKEILGTGCKFCYSGFEVIIPEKYDYYLTQLFGNYKLNPNR